MHMRKMLWLLVPVVVDSENVLALKRPCCISEPLWMPSWRSSSADRLTGIDLYVPEIAT